MSICIICATEWRDVGTDRCFVCFVTCARPLYDLHLMIHCVKGASWAFWNNWVCLFLLRLSTMLMAQQSTLSWSDSVSSYWSQTYTQDLVMSGLELLTMRSLWWLRDSPAGADVAFMSYGGLLNCHIPASKYCSCQQKNANYGWYFAIFLTAPIRQ